MNLLDKDFNCLTYAQRTGGNYGQRMERNQNHVWTSREIKKEKLLKGNK